MVPQFSSYETLLCISLNIEGDSYGFLVSKESPLGEKLCYAHLFFLWSVSKTDVSKAGPKSYDLQFRGKRCLCLLLKNAKKSIWDKHN